MSHLRLAILALCTLSPAVAGAADGGLYLYLQPLPSDAARLTFAIASVSAISVNGTEHPLKVVLKTVSQASAGRQRLLASGRLPMGSYVGLRLKVARAALIDQRGETALESPDQPARLDVPFAAGREPILLWLALKYQESVAGGFGFNPAFTTIVAPRPIADHVGLVSNSGSNTLTVFDKSLSQAAAVIDTCAQPEGLALDQRRRRAYVACSRDDEIQAIDVTAAEVVERTRLFPGDGPRELALTPDGTTLLSVNTASNSVSFFEADSLTRQERVTVGNAPGSLLIEPSGRRAFVFNTLSNSVSVIDIAGRSLVATLSTEAAPVRGQFSPRGDRLYVIHERSPFMTVVDPRQLNIVTRARVRSGVSAIAVDRVRNLVYLSGRDDSLVEFYDPNALVPVNTMRAPSGASYLAINVEDGSLYMVSPDTGSVVVGNLGDRKIVSEIDVGEKPYWLVVMGEK